MKRAMRTLIITVLTLVMVLLTACTTAEEPSKPVEQEKTEEKTQYKYENIVPPEISSDDRVMSSFLDITLYNVENYAEIYLGKKYKVSAKFDGVKLSAPSDFNTLINSGFTLAEGSEYNADTTIYAGDKCLITLIGPKGNSLICEFYNSSAKSKQVKDCELIKYKSFDDMKDADNIYSHLYVNGITGTSSLSDVITKLGYPSHFHKESDNLYSLDYFFTKKDLRARITIYAIPTEDTVTSVAYCKYK